MSTPALSVPKRGRRIIDVPCPYCQAKVGARCTTSGGETMTNRHGGYHLKRVAAARATVGPGDMVSFAHGARRVVAYVIRAEERAAVCMGLLIDPENDTGWPQASMRWRVPIDNLTVHRVSVAGGGP